MDAVRDVSSVANALRKREGKRVRLPLPLLTVVVPDAGSLGQFDDILRDELNVKAVELVELRAETPVEYGITNRLTVNARAAGPRLGKQVQQVIQAAKAGDWAESDGVVVAGGIALEPAEYQLVLETSGRPEGEALSVLPGGGFVLLETATTPELEAEGLARDVVRAVQDTRKAAGFEVSDRIALTLRFSDAADGAAVRAAFHVADIAGETLALSATVDGAVLAGSTFDAASEPGHSAEFTAGAFANRGAFTVGVTRIGGAA
jgi:isoleucyl-tRNA synthetase